MKIDNSKDNISKNIKIEDIQVENAIKLILQWIGDDPNREGLKDTPKRVLSGFKEYFSGYGKDPRSVLKKTFVNKLKLDDSKKLNISDVSDTSNKLNKFQYKDIILLRNIRIESHCEHHMAPIIGTADIAYVPNEKIIGISKLARIVDIYSKRLQIQENLTTEIANTIYEELNAKGVAVIISAVHSCMTKRGVHNDNSNMVTNVMLGCFQDDEKVAACFWNMINTNKIL